jgi:glutaredoxin
MRVELYTKPDCPLCEQGQALLQQVCRARGLEWLETSIYSSSALFELYRYEVPVLCVDGRKVLTLRFELAQVEEALSPATVR